MAKGGKARTVIIRMISTAQTGFFYTTKRVRLNSPKLSAVKYDPIVKSRLAFHIPSVLFANETPLSLLFAILHPAGQLVNGDRETLRRSDMEEEQYTLQLDRTHLLFIPSLELAHDGSSSSGTVVQVCLRGDHGQGNLTDILSVEQESVTRTIETLLVGHVHASPKLPERVVIKEAVPGYTLIGHRKPWKYGRGKRFCLGDATLQPAEHKWVFHFEITG